MTSSRPTATPWPFNIIRLVPGRRRDLAGQGHNIHDFNLIRWNGLTDEMLLSIKRTVILKGLAKYQKARGAGAVAPLER